MNKTEPFAETTDTQVDLTTCDREPIHILGRVQSYGALIAVSSDWIVQHASDNMEDLLGQPAADIIGLPLDQIIPAQVLTRIRSKIAEGAEQVSRLFGIRVMDAKLRYDISVHYSGRHMVIEFEPKQAPIGDRDTMSEVYPLVQRIRNAASLKKTYAEAARALRALSGFDSVMVYQFQPDESGVVVAEDRRGDLPSYMDLRFPASDIPQQARALYRRNLLRLIADVNDEGVKLVPQVSPEGRPLDLSLSVTRAVSPIHIEYLRNMGVQASMSVSIMRNGKLWGLFACHHRTPRYLEFERRTAIELFAHMFSYELSHLEEQQKMRAQEDMSRLQSRLMSLMVEGDNLSDSLLKVSSNLREVIPHDGMALYVEGEYKAIGSVPTAEEFQGLARFLNTTAASGVFVSECLGEQYPPAADNAERYAGLIAIPVSRRPRDYLVLFRREIATSVVWAGNPEKPAQLGPNGMRLTPRKSFEAWREVVSGNCSPWSKETRHSAELLRVLLLEIFLKITDAAAEDRRKAQERQELLISELNHRVRNILNLMRGLVKQSRQDDDSVEDFSGRLEGRIQSMARAHDQLTEEEWAYASFKELIGLELAAYVAGDPDRVEILGGDVQVSPKAFTNLALVVHELVTNSVKYGALSQDTGRIVIALAKDDFGGLTFDWRERGGPPVNPPKRRGFGTAIIERFVPFELQGEAAVSYKVTGLEARFVIPASHVEFSEVQAATPTAAMEEGGAGLDLTGVALVLEDNMIIAMDAADIMTDLGASDVRIASNVSNALREIEANPIQVAVLDVNLGSEQSLPVAEKLASMGVPFVLATGYGEREDLVDLYPPCPIVRKPFSNETLSAAIAKLAKPTS